MNLFKKLFKQTSSPVEPPVKDDVVETVFSKLKSMADPKCRKCYGRGYTCVNRTTKKIHGCLCLRKMSEKKEHLARKDSGNATVFKFP